MAVGDAHVFPGFLTPELNQLFFQNPPTTFLTCFCRGERRKYAGKKVRLNRGSNSQPPGHESDTLTTEPSGLATAISTDANSKHVHVTIFLLLHNHDFKRLWENSEHKKKRRSLVRSPARPILFPRIDDSHCDRIHSSLTAVRCFDNGYVGKQPVAWK